jgi:periplasmic divalent cation tolerance protein
MMSEIVVFITTSDEDEAARIAKELVGTQLAGCVNIIRNIRSIYSWEGTVEDDPEVLMVVKTRKTLFQQLQKKVQELHSYSVPEIIAIPIEDGSPAYLKWLRSVTG